MRLSTHLLLLVLITTFGMSSCTLIPNVDETADIIKKLQKKEWTLTRFIVNGNDITFTPQVFNFISDTEIEYTFIPNGWTETVTETHPFEINFSTDFNIKFNIEIPDIFFILSVVSLTDDVMTIGLDNGGSYSILEFK